MADGQAIDYVLACGERYIPRQARGHVQRLPISVCASPFGPTLSLVILPDWASDIGVGDPPALLVPSYCLQAGRNGEDWQRCDWWQACFSFLTGEAERAFEADRGPVHSYAFRLPAGLSALFDHAWVNRILLFLRRWAAREAHMPEAELFGARPKAEIVLTHDIDEMQKTVAIRLKKAAFDLFNALRLLRRGQVGDAGRRLWAAAMFMARRSDYVFLDRIDELERGCGRTSIFNFYGAGGGWWRSPRRILLDPEYDVSHPHIAARIRRLVRSGHAVGLHQSFDAWGDAEPMRRERIRLAEAAGCEVTACRQHWLRFSWHDTWPAQEAAGFTLDTTLGFNDRPAFRNGAALRTPAWIATTGKASDSLQALPLVLMDSHLFDYQMLSDDQRRATIDRWLGEIAAVGGTASVLWHQRVFHPLDYGWGADYEYLLARLGQI